MNNKILKKEQIQNIFTILHANNPSPTTELVYSSNFELLIAVVLSAQATDISVNKATQLLFKIANTPDKILSLGIAGLEKHIKTIGLYKIKAKNIIGLCKILVDKHHTCVPNNFIDLIELPGVGRKTANVILNTLFDHDTIAVDTHIFRVGNRLGIAKGKTPLQVELQLSKVIPPDFKRNAHHWLILHGRYVCRARSPNCTSCVISEYCEYFKKFML